VQDLRAVLSSRGGQRYADMAATRDAALEALGAREARIRELQATVHELAEQLQRQTKALSLGGCSALDSPRAHDGLSLQRTPYFHAKGSNPHVRNRTSAHKEV
jgi:hypothetical protein